MGAGAIGLTWAAQLWQLYVVFPLMAVGWAAMSGAALNLIVAPWFERRRGLAISIAFNGAAVGGVLLGQPQEGGSSPSGDGQAPRHVPGNRQPLQPLSRLV